MSKSEDTRPQDINEKKWYQSAKLPWGIIAFVAVVATSFASGWHMRQSYEQSYDQNVQNEASAMTQVKVQASVTPSK